MSENQTRANDPPKVEGKPPPALSLPDEDRWNMFHIREMKVEDIPQVLLIDRLSFSLPWPENSYRFELLDNNASLLWVTEANLPNEQRKIVGMIVVWLVADEAHIATLAVHPEYRRQGIGKRLLAKALRECAQRGARLATLEVRQTNAAAQEMYCRFGFEIVGRRAHYYNDNGEDAIIMTVTNLPERIPGLRA